jgi:hypothetical protein
MLTKNPDNRADWASIFAFEIKDGEILTSSMAEKKNFKTLTDSGLKSSLTPTVDSSTSPKVDGQTLSYSQKDFGKIKQEDTRSGSGSGSGIENMMRNDAKNDMLYNPKASNMTNMNNLNNTNNANNMRSTYTTKSPLR